MNFAKETLRALRGDHGDGVSDIVGGEDFGRVFRTASCKPGEYGAGADRADADAVAAEVFGHATAEALQSPFGGTVDSAAGKGTLPGLRGDIYDVAGLSLDHAGNNGARN